MRSRRAWPLARTHLERVIAEPTSDVIVDRHSIYEHEEDWVALASCCFARVPKQLAALRLSYLVRAVSSMRRRFISRRPRFRFSKLVGRAEICGRLALADALLQTNRADDAVRVLGAARAIRISSPRALRARARTSDHKRPSGARARVAHRLRTSAFSMRSPVSRPRMVNSISPAHYHALLLLCRGAREGRIPQSARSPGLTDIAERKNDPERAAELRASASEAMSLASPLWRAWRARRADTTDRPGAGKGHGKRRSWPVEL
jgi:hypothetical protein